jgi:hypothetical protein
MVVGPGTLGLEWEEAEHADLATEFTPESIEEARAALARIHERNPAAVVLVELYYFEADADAYPGDSPWWARNKKGERVQFWPGHFNMKMDDPDYVRHIAARAAAIHRAVEGKAGLFLDNLRFDKKAKAGWLALLKQIEEECGPIPILANAGWASDDLDWVAPHLNGIMYEDSLHHTEDGDQEAFYGRVRALQPKLRAPLLGVNEIFGPREDAATSRRELIRTLVYTDQYYLYSDSTNGHHHSWSPLWDAPLGAPLDPPAEPAPGRLARRRFEGGEVLWLPASAKDAATVELVGPLVPAEGGDPAREVKLRPGEGAILVRPR